MSNKRFLMIVLGAFAFLTSGCASHIIVPEVRQHSDSNLACHEIQSEIQTAQMHKNNAQAENRFQAKLLFPPTGFYLMYKMIKATDNADKRMKYLKELYNQKRCASRQDRGERENQGYIKQRGYNQQRSPYSSGSGAGSFYDPSDQYIRPDPYLGVMDR